MTNVLSAYERFVARLNFLTETGNYAPSGHTAEDCQRHFESILSYPDSTPPEDRLRMLEGVIEDEWKSRQDITEHLGIYKGLCEKYRF